LLALLRDETGGDPMKRQKWARLSLGRLSDLLRRHGHPADPKTVRRLLLKLGYSLKANRKRYTGPPHPDRDRQFRYISRLKGRFLRAGWPVLSVDTKKKELIGNFKNAGRCWCRQADEVNAHDFRHEASHVAVPYGLYNLNQDRGSIHVGVSGDTPQFAVDAITLWWQAEGRLLFPGAPRLLILADAGGSNSCRSRLWKLRLQEQLADAYGLAVTVCHYPRGASKWNPVEHRLFSHISINWAGRPLRSLSIMLGLIRGTRTETGSPVNARVLWGVYRTGIKVTDGEMKAIRWRRHKTCPSWNYTIKPRQPQ
jgi:hypothetical protein